MNFELFKFSLLLQLKEFKEQMEKESFESKNFDIWFEKFMEFLGYNVTDDEEEKGEPTNASS